MDIARTLKETNSFLKTIASKAVLGQEKQEIKLEDLGIGSSTPLSNQTFNPNFDDELRELLKESDDAEEEALNLSDIFKY